MNADHASVLSFLSVFPYQVIFIASINRLALSILHTVSKEELDEVGSNSPPGSCSRVHGTTGASLMIEQAIWPPRLFQTGTDGVPNPPPR